MSSVELLELSIVRTETPWLLAVVVKLTDTQTSCTVLSRRQNTVETSPSHHILRPHILKFRHSFNTTVFPLTPIELTIARSIILKIQFILI
jgi:hypothetical protein